MSRILPLMRFGQYEVVGELGRGGMGIVYKGFDPLIRRDVALKTIRLSDFAHSDERRQMQERLEREAQSAGRLSHPNIVTIYQIGYTEHEGETTAFIAMEYVPGRNLATLLEKIRPSNPEPILALLRQTAAGLDYAHRNGVVHRDVKPANLLVTVDGQLKITDFGVAKITSQSMTMTGTVLGSPFYMSPEQIRAEAIDGRTDQYSLAVVAYEIFGGRKPFQAETLSSLVYKIAHEPPPPIALDSTAFADQLNPVLLRALSKQAGDRFSSCTEFVDVLAAALRQPGLASAVAQSVPPAPPAAPVEAAQTTQVTQATQAPPPPIRAATPQTVTDLSESARVAAAPQAAHPLAQSASRTVQPVAPPPFAQTGTQQFTPQAMEGGSKAKFWVAAGVVIGLLGAGALVYMQQSEQTPPPTVTDLRQTPPSEPVSTRPVSQAEPERPKPEETAKSSAPSVTQPAQQRPAPPPVVPTAKTAIDAAKSDASKAAAVKNDAAKKDQISPPVATQHAGAAAGSTAAVTPTTATPPPVTESKPAATAAQTQQPGGQSGALTLQVVTQPRVLRQAPAEYTDQARRAGIEGMVVLSVDIDERGIPVKARVVRSLDPGLDKKAIESLAEWRFAPGTANGVAVASNVSVEVVFRLAGGGPKARPSLKRP